MADDLIYKTYKLTIKASEADGTFDGVASTSAIDSDGEIVDKGAFTRTLSASKGVFPILWQHIREVPVGWNKSAEEDDRGLVIHGQLLMNSDKGRYAHDFISVGLDLGGKPGLSIGFQVPKGGDYIKDGVRHFKEVNLREVSIVTFPANSEAVVTGSKGAVAFGDLPVAGADLTWDVVQARASLVEFAGGPEKEKINFAKYRKGFFWFDPDNPMETESYKLPFATVVNGKLMAVPAGIKASGDELNTVDIPEADKSKVKTVISRYYTKMKKDSPFKGEVEGGVVKTNVEFRTQDFADQMARSQALEDHYEKRYKADRALADVIDNICQDKDCKRDAKKPLIHKAIDGHSDVMKGWWSGLLDLLMPQDEEEEPQDPEDMQEEVPEDQAMAAAMALIAEGGSPLLSAKEGRILSARTKKALERCMSLVRESIGYSKMSQSLKAKALGQLGDLGTGRYFNDVNLPNPVGGGAGKPPAPVTTNPVGGGKTSKPEPEPEPEDSAPTPEDQELLDGIALSLKNLKAS